MDDELDLGEEVEEALGKGIVNVSQEVGTYLPLIAVVARINHHFRAQDLGYKHHNGDTFMLRVRSRKYPFFGTFNGKVHIYEKLGHMHPHRHVYKIEGLLRYHISFLWFIGVFSFFFLLMYITSSALWQGALFTTIGTAIVIAMTYELGRSQQEDVDDRVENAFLALRGTLNNLR